jgi:hypothetical protein
MSESPNFRDVQKRTLQLLNYEDGIWDLLLGFIFMLLAVYPVTRAALGPTWNLVLYLVCLTIGVVVSQLVRYRISTPRLGYVKPKRARSQKLLVLVLIILVSATLGLVIATLISPETTGPSTSSPSTFLGRYWVDLLALAFLVLIFSGMGYAFGVNRLYLYGWLIGIGNLASVFLNRGAPERFNLPLAIAAGIILLIGISQLMRFLRDYPVQAEEVLNG